jgi:hypothetical protein
MEAQKRPIQRPNRHIKCYSGWRATAALKSDRRERQCPLPRHKFVTPPMDSAPSNELTPQMSRPKGKVVYTDKWLTLNSNGTLLLHRYYFCKPTRKLVVREIDSIESVMATNLGRWEYKKWGIGVTWIMWSMDFGRKTFSRGGPPEEVRKRLLLIRTAEGWLHKIGVTCENVTRFLDEMEKMGVSVVREGDV